ncbi:beta family protein [Ferrovibrio sp.]|uniref:beta family protein n=1 Tax=Ferrovibrio sp. TaxID=1917215 RepID=UPI003514789A
MFNHKHYVPVLKWRQGEYLALSKLGKLEKSKITPVLDIPPVEWDFEKGEHAKTIDRHLETFGARLEKNWGTRPIFVDLKLVDQKMIMSDGTHPITRVHKLSVDKKCNCIFVTGLNRPNDYQVALKSIVPATDGLAIRLNPNHFADVKLQENLETLLNFLGAKSKPVDLILDLLSPSFQPLAGFTALVINQYNKLLSFRDWRTVTIAATAFPKTMAGINPGVFKVERLEWTFYKTLVEALGGKGRLPTFGDYCIAHPELPTEDPRKFKPAATVRYTSDGSWLISKGTTVRKKDGFKQYRQRCEEIVARSEFRGAGYSMADQYISDCAEGKASTGNLTTWRWVGTNHHITNVTEDLAKFFAA